MSTNLGRVKPARIKQARESRCYSEKELADMIGISKQSISQYETGRIAPSDQVLLQLSNILSYPVSFFVKDFKTNNFAESPVFFRSRKTTKAISKKAAKARISIFKEFMDYFKEYLDFPEPNIPMVEYDDISKEYSIEEIEKFALELRKYWDLGNRPIPNLINVIQKNGIIVSEMKTGYDKIDALSVYNGNRPYIFLNSDKESNSKLRFSIAHELGHLVMHANLVSDDELDIKKLDAKLEWEANKFAAAFLLPSESFEKDIISSSIDYFIQIKGKWLSSISSMIMRCEDLGLLSENQITYLRRQMTQRRYWKKEPLDDVIKIEKPFLFRQAIELLLDRLVLTKSQLIEDLCCGPDEIEKYCFLEPGTLSEKIPNNIIQIKFDKMI